MPDTDTIKQVVCLILILDEMDNIPGKWLLLVKKDENWFLPGGKVEDEETNLECLKREMSEELPYARYSLAGFFNEYPGVTPTSKSEVNVRVYFGDWESGSILHANEIEDSQWGTADQSTLMNISQISRDIISDLCAEGLF
jgi:8-oxo-dGTP pyrophosphatase MutT (NUDIX family)